MRFNYQIINEVDNAKLMLDNLIQFFDKKRGMRSVFDESQEKPIFTDEEIKWVYQRLKNLSQDLGKITIPEVEGLIND